MGSFRLIIGLNDNLEQQAQAIFKHTCSLANESTTVGAYAYKIYSGGTPLTTKDSYWNGPLKWMSSGETRSRFIVSTEKKITREGANKSATKLAYKYDTVIASAGQGMTRGQTSMLLCDSYVNQSLIVINAEADLQLFLFFYLSNRYEELRAISDSSSIRGSLTTKMIASLSIPKMNSSSLRKFSSVVRPFIQAIANNLRKNKELRLISDSILPRLMSGDLDVSDIEL